MSEQLFLLDWKAPINVLPFPLHRSHGATAGVAKEIVLLDTAKRTGRLNSLRAQTRKRLAPVVGQEQADRIADDLVRMVRVQIAYRQGSILLPQKQITPQAVILSLRGERIETLPHGDGAGEAGALGQGTKFLVGVGEAHVEYDAARTREGGAA